MTEKIKRAERWKEYPVKTEVEILTPLDYRDMGNGLEVKLIAPFLVRLIEHYHDGTIEIRLIEVPAEFISDLASVPRLAQGLIPRFGKWNAGAVVHDWLYVHGKIEGRAITQARADRIFLAIMRATKVGWRKTPMFIAVRMGGKSMWDANRKRDSLIEEGKL
ncbi:MAG: DUF1353 domain-containing protein [Candidatus Omnitrophota bacterium]|jgi:hypothetical protein